MYVPSGMKKWSNIELADEAVILVDDRWVASVMEDPPIQPQCVDDPSLSTQHMLATEKQ